MPDSGSPDLLAPTQPTEMQRRIIRDGPFRWFVQTPLCAAVATWTIRRYRKVPARTPQARAIWRITAAAALPMVAFDFWFYGRARKHVADYDEWERVQQRMRRVSAAGSSGSGSFPEEERSSLSSSGDTEDPWA